MMLRPTKTLLAGVALTALMALAKPTLAEELRGRVIDAFGSRLVIEDHGARFLVMLPPGVTAPSEGTRIVAEGTLDGRTLSASSIVVDPGPRHEPRGDRHGAGPRHEPRGDRHGVGPRPEPRFEGPRDRDRMVGASPSIAAVDAAAPPRLPGVTDLTLRHRSRSGDLHWSGQLGEEGYIRLVTDWDGAIKRVETDGAPLPGPVIDRVLPLRPADLSETDRLAAVTLAEIRPRGEIVLRGPDASGAEIELIFDRRGRLERVERRLPLPGLDRAEVAARLQAAGYRDIGWIGYGPRHAEAEATNPHGDRVQVHINRDGEIDRERLWNR